MARLSEELHGFAFEETRGERISLAEILVLAGERTFGILFVLLALPSALPLPAPGYSIPFGIVMFLLALQLVAGRRRPWVPERWQTRSFDTPSVQRVLTAGLPWLRRLEGIARPRFTFVCRSAPGRIVIGIAISLMSVSMMIPIPGTNTLPAMGIFVTGFGLLEDDGIISVAGLVLCVGGLLLTSLILVFGYEGVKLGIEALKGLLLTGR